MVQHRRRHQQHQGGGGGGGGGEQQKQQPMNERMEGKKGKGGKHPRLFKTNQFSVSSNNDQARPLAFESPAATPEEEEEEEEDEFHKHLTDSCDNNNLQWGDC